MFFFFFFFFHSALSLIASFMDLSIYLLQTLKKNNSVITCGRVMVLALCTFSDSHLSIFYVSFNSLLYFQRYAPDKLFTAKTKKGNNFVNAGDRVMFLAFCNFPYSPLSVD